MEKRRLGHADLSVTALGYGAMELIWVNQAFLIERNAKANQASLAAYAYQE